MMRQMNPDVSHGISPIGQIRTPQKRPNGPPVLLTCEKVWAVMLLNRPTKRPTQVRGLTNGPSTL